MSWTVSQLAEAVEAVAGDVAFSGVVRVDRDGEAAYQAAFGLAQRGHEVPNTVDTRFAVASGAKGFTALAVVRLIEQGRLALDTTARSVLGADLPLVADDVTVEHLLAHRSGIGDYLDEESLGDIADYVLKTPVHLLAETEGFLAELDGHPTKFPAGTDFSYCNGGYILLALIAERVSGTGYHQLVDELVCRPAGLADTAFLRSDQLPDRTATGYLLRDGRWRSNVLHLPVRGNGDGGIYTTAADMNSFWGAFLAGRIVGAEWVAELTRPHSAVPAEKARYGLGFWLDETGPQVRLAGYDAGVSFSSTHDPSTDVTWSVLGNSDDGAWPVARAVRSVLADSGR
ncbi:serine hydrolase domain-containing protein [Phytomonospora endophytica]|uniref:CubicO group peptidase (Beta-lactamase class C family) n=1 Tax=Phytomonospora endophytica TaxID=714109 RepID=A0A841G1Q9_9ACTN|nr:serine hydrolase domain-containing protein [Phytomonospora endophytica]MBB6038619.1 CubicO group peptidase (beta-lactamase class C family) [Phytomonospora endophytica]